MIGNFTIVTGIWDIGRSDIEEFTRPFSNYLDCFSNLLELDFNFCIYIPSKLIPFVQERRDFDSTRIMVRELSDIKEFKHFDKIQEIRKLNDWVSRANWIKNSPQCSLEYYNPIVMSKLLFLQECSEKNPFNTKYFYWLDGGITNTVNVSFLKKLDSIESFMRKIEDKFLTLSFEYFNEQEVHGFDSREFYDICGGNLNYVCRGGFFGGSAEAIESVSEKYVKIMDRCFQKGCMGTEENFLTILSRESEVYRYELDSSLVWSFFNQLR